MIYRKLAHAQPWFDLSAARVYPSYHVIAGLAAASGARCIDTDSSAPSKVAALAHRSRSGQVLWLANLSGETQRLKVKGFDGPAKVHVLDERSFEAAVRDPAWLESGGTTPSARWEALTFRPMELSESRAADVSCYSPSGSHDFMVHPFSGADEKCYFKAHLIRSGSFENILDRRASDTGYGIPAHHALGGIDFNFSFAQAKQARIRILKRNYLFRLYRRPARPRRDVCFSRSTCSITQPREVENHGICRLP